MTAVITIGGVVLRRATTRIARRRINRGASANIIDYDVIGTRALAAQGRKEQDGGGRKTSFSLAGGTVDRAATRAAQSGGGKGTSALRMWWLHMRASALSGREYHRGYGGSVTRISFVTGGLATTRVGRSVGGAQHTRTRIHADLESGCLVDKRHVAEATR